MTLLRGDVGALLGHRATHQNGNTNATPATHLEPAYDAFDISLTVCFAGTSNCAPPVVRQYYVATVE
jgi:hypothetical protein